MTLILGATLTLLSLIIGFTFSMAIHHFDQRKSYESAEANTIRTVYLRADLLSPAEAANFRSARTTQLQADIWSAVHAFGMLPLLVLAINDVFNARSSAEAFWANRISLEAWTLLGAIAICGNVLVGYGARTFSARTIPILILPPVFLISISLYLIDDIDSPRSGLISVGPENLRLLSAALTDAVTPSLSSDVETSMSADMFTMMRSCFLLQRVMANERSIQGDKDAPKLLTARDVIAMATVQGAKDCGLDKKVGTLTPGKEADIVMLRADTIDSFPLNNAYGAIITGMDTSNVDTVMVAGKIVKRHGKLVGVDLARIRKQATQARDYIVSKMNWPHSVLDTTQGR